MSEVNLNLNTTEVHFSQDSDDVVKVEPIIVAVDTNPEVHETTIEVQPAYEVILAGDQGDRGEKGDAGPAGATWHLGTGSPDDSSTVGNNEDFYFDSLSSNVYHKKNDVWTFVVCLKGEDGYVGKDGSVWLNGSGAPTASVGSINDYYINNATGEYYQKATAYAWNLIGNFATLHNILNQENTWNAAQTFGLVTNLVERIGNATHYSERRYTLGTYTIGPNSGPVDIAELAFNSNVFCGMKADYILKRGTSSVRCGTIYISTDGLSTSITFSDAEVGTCGVDFSAALVGGIVRVYWKADATPLNATARFEFTLYKL